MKHLATVSFVSLLAIVGCENAHSKLDEVPAPKEVVSPSKAPKPTPMAEKPVAHTGSIEDRVAALEARLDRSAEALNFLDQAYNAQKKQAEDKERSEPAPDAIFAVDIAGNLKAGQFDGAIDAPITIIDAFDFACPYCRKVSTTLDEIVKEYDGKVRVVYKDMIVHQPATDAHFASCAAAKQGKYSKFKAAFWEKGFDPYAAQRDVSKLGKDNIFAIAQEIGLDVEKMKVDMAGPDCAAHMAGDRKELEKFEVNSTPTLYVNGTVVGGALPKEYFKEMIDQKLKVVAQSGVKAGEFYDKEIMGKGEKKFRSKVDPKPQ